MQRPLLPLTYRRMAGGDLAMSWHGDRALDPGVTHTLCGQSVQFHTTGILSAMVSAGTGEVVISSNIWHCFFSLVNLPNPP